MSAIGRGGWRVRLAVTLALALALGALAGCAPGHAAARRAAETRVAALREAMPHLREGPLVRRASGDSLLDITAYLDGDSLRIYRTQGEVRDREWDATLIYFDADRLLAQHEVIRFAPGVDPRGRRRIETEWLFAPDGTVLHGRMTVDGRDHPLAPAVGAWLHRNLSDMPAAVRAGLIRRDSVLSAGGDPLAP
jgi:hypothetical protein